MPIFEVPITTIPIVGETGVFQVRRIYCIGRNYAAHAKELGNEVPAEPLLFLKPPSSLLAHGGRSTFRPRARMSSTRRSSAS